MKVQTIYLIIAFWSCFGMHLSAESQTVKGYFNEFESGLSANNPHILHNSSSIRTANGKLSATTIQGSDFDAHLAQLKAIKNHTLYAPFQFSIATAEPEITRQERKLFLVEITNSFHSLLALKYGEDPNFRLSASQRNLSWVLAIHINHLRIEYPITADILLLRRSAGTALFRQVDSIRVTADSQTLAHKVAERALETLHAKARHAW
jgi:hypothetical protein